MSSLLVLPYHSQDNSSSSPEPSIPKESKVLQILVPPQSARTTGSSVHWRPCTARTGHTGVSGLSGRSSALDTLDALVSQLGEEVEADAWDAEEPEEQYDEKRSLGTSTAMSGRRPWVKKADHVRARMRHILHHPKFHYTIIGLVILDLIAVFLDITISLLNLSCYTPEQMDQFRALGVSNPPVSASCVLQESVALNGGEWFLWALSVSLLCIFTSEIIASFFAFGPRHFTKPLYAIDAIVVFVSLIMEVYFKFGNQGKAGQSPAALIVLRLWKIVRAIHAIAHSIELKNQSVIHAVREAMAEIEQEQRATAVLVERTQAKVDYLRERLPAVRDDELDRYADNELEKKRALLEKEKIDNGSEDLEANNTHTPA